MNSHFFLEPIIKINPVIFIFFLVNNEYLLCHNIWDILTLSSVCHTTGLKTTVLCFDDFKSHPQQ